MRFHRWEALDWMRLYLALTIALIAFALPRAALAAAGDPDPTFGVGGESVVAVGEGDSALWRMTVARDGSIVAVVRHATLLGEGGDALVRFTKDGHLDPSFGRGGIVRLTGLQIEATPVVEPDGDLLVGGFVLTQEQPFQFAVAQFKNDGTPDSRFGDHGRTIVPFPSDADATGVGRDADGRILAAGVSADKFAVTRLKPGGALDTGFGDGGMTVSALSPGRSGAWALAVDDSGRALVAGGGTELDSNGFERQYPLLVRYTTHGRLDGSFGSGGVVRVPFRGDTGAAGAVLVQPNGSIVVTGGGAYQAGDRFLLVPLFRYRPNGTLDGSFGNGGDASVRRPEVSTGYALVRQPDGKLLVSSSGRTGSLEGDAFGTAWSVLRFGQDGSLDRSFGDRGVATTALGPDYSFPFGLGVQPDGGIVEGGISIDCRRHVASLVRFEGRSGGPPLGAPTIRGCDPIASSDGVVVSVPVDCPIVASVCKGSVALRHRSTHIGAGRFNLGSARHRTRVLQIRSSRRARRLIKAHRQVSATATFRVRGKRGRAHTIVRRVTIKR